MKLPKIKSKPKKQPEKYIYQIFGEPKAGKSTLLSKFPKAMFIATEPGLKFLEVYGGDYVHQTWDDIRDTVKNLLTEDHDFETVIFDTADNAWDMCSKYSCAKMGIDHESDADFGKGWSATKKEFKSVVDALANRGYGVCFTSHVKDEEREYKGVKRKFINNTLGSGARKYINGLCDFIFYMYIDDEGNRLIKTKSDLHTNAGDRSGILPEVMAADYELIMGTLRGDWDESRDSSKA